MVAGATSEWKLRDYPQPAKVPKHAAAANPRPTEVFLSLEDPLNPRVIAVATPKGATGRVVRYPNPQTPAACTNSHVSTTASHAPSYEWGPVPTRFSHEPELSHWTADAMLFGNSITHNKAAPMRDGQKKLEQWKRSRAQRNIHERGAASRRWADDASETPQLVQHSRSTSAWSVDSVDSREPEQRPPWVNPVDCSATQTEGDGLAEADDFAAEVGSTTTTTRPEARRTTATNHWPSNARDPDDVPRSDGWNRWSKPVGGAIATAGFVNPSHLLVSSSGTVRAQDAPCESNQRVHLTHIIRASDRRSSSSASSSANDERNAHRAEAQTINTKRSSDSETMDPSREAMMAAFQAQQEDMFRIIAAQQERIEALANQQENAQVREVPAKAATPTIEQPHDAPQNPSNKVAHQTSTPIVDINTMPSAVPTALMHRGNDVVAAEHHAPTNIDPIAMHRKVSQDVRASAHASTKPSGHADVSLATQTTQTPVVEVRGMYVDPEFLDDRDTQRELAVLKGILDIDQSAIAVYRTRNEEAIAQTSQRRELSRKLTRHLALQQRSPLTAVWSRSQSTKSNESDQRTLAPQAPTTSAPAAMPNHYCMPSMANVALHPFATIRDTPSATDAVTMTEWAFQGSSWTSGGAPPERRDASTTRMSPVPTPVVCDASTDAIGPTHCNSLPVDDPIPLHGSALHRPQQRPMTTMSGAPTPVAEHAERRSDLIPPAHRTASPPPPPPRTHDPMQAFLALRDRYLRVREGNEQRANPVSSPLTSSWRRV